MDAASSHVVILGGPEAEPELLAMVLDDGQAVPLFDSSEEAGEFLDSLTGLSGEWTPVEVSVPDLVTLLEHQDEGVRYVALSPPPEDMAGGMEVQVLEREVLTDLLRRQTMHSEAAPEDAPREEKKSFLRRILGG